MSKKSLDRDVIHPKIVELIRLWGESIAATRRRQQLSISGLAARIGVSTQTALRLEAGDPAIRVATYMTAFQVLGVLADLVPEPPLAIYSREHLKQRIRSSGGMPQAGDDEYF